jgi:peptidylprolyl isomerase domain and WD repeat-containing protein 1
MADDSESDDDFGPMPVAAADAVEVEQREEEDDRPKRKKARTLKFESVYVDNLPSADFYEHSFMHRDVVTHVGVSKATEFIITGSHDGHVKFWKKMKTSIEFVKHYHAHLGPIHTLVVSTDEKMLVTTSADRMVKFFEINGFDMSNMVSTDYVPNAATWLSGPRNICDRVAVSDMNSGSIRVYKTEGGNEALHTIDLHFSPVRYVSPYCDKCLRSDVVLRPCFMCMYVIASNDSALTKFVHRISSCPCRCMVTNAAAQCVISADSRGMIEYWDINTFAQPSAEKLTFSLKSDTDLYDLAKARTVPHSLAVAKSGLLFSTFSSDKQIRVFDFSKGKLLRKYDESAEAYSKAAPDSAHSVAAGLDPLDMGRRLATERELESSPEALGMCNMCFDESGHFLIFGTLKGIKIVNVVTNKVVRVLGLGESGERFLNVALYQGVPMVDTQFLLNKAGGDALVVKTVAEMESNAIVPDPTVYCTSFKKRRFYCFSRREPDEATEGRDKFNELPTEEERQGGATVVPNKNLAQQAVLHTTMGDIVIKLFPDECPLAVENFTTHVRNGYYDR